MVASGSKNLLEQRMKVCTLLWDAGIKVGAFYRYTDTRYLTLLETLSIPLVKTLVLLQNLIFCLHSCGNPTQVKDVIWDKLLFSYIKLLLCSLYRSFIHLGKEIVSTEMGQEHMGSQGQNRKGWVSASAFSVIIKLNLIV